MFPILVWVLSYSLIAGTHGGIEDDDFFDLDSGVPPIVATTPEISVNESKIGKLPVGAGLQLSKDLPFIARDMDILSVAVEGVKGRVCREQCRLVLAGLENLTTWAVKFYDATSKSPEGVLAGSRFQLGNLDECLEIGREEHGTPPGIRGQYCLGNVTIEQPPGDSPGDEASIWKKFGRPSERYVELIDYIHWGICIPEACSPGDTELLIEKILANALPQASLKVIVNVSEKSCYKEQLLTVHLIDILYMAIILSILSIIIAGTAFHGIYLKGSEVTPPGVLPQILLAFSLIANLKKLFGPAHEASDAQCISGIKFIAMMFIIAGHTLIFVISGPVLNQKFWEEAITKVENAVFVNNPLLVDTFLFLSGFLFCRIILQELDKRKSVNFLLLYIYRIIRLTPAYMVMVGLYVTWLSKLDYGPLWSRMILEKERCLASWWANILYINNYVNTNQLCMFQSWYLSVDTQLFLLAPIVVYPLWKWRKIGECILGSVTVLSIVIPFTVTFVLESDPTLMIYSSEVRDLSDNEYFKNIYIKTHMRATAYCFGLVYGYIVHRIKTSDTQLSKFTVIVGWIVGTSSLLMSMYSISIFYGPRRNFTIIEAAFYAALHKVLWSAGTGWILLACITNNSGPINSFLKLKAFVPLSRLTYSAYLVNGLVELHSVSTTRSLQYMDTYNLFSKVLSHLMLTFGGAVILSTMFESPILGLERIFLRQKRRSLSTPPAKIDAGETTVVEA